VKKLCTHDAAKAGKGKGGRAGNEKISNKKKATTRIERTTRVTTKAKPLPLHHSHCNVQ
jgi:hypothetical protein